MEHFYAVIMAGGGGTRLWPLSRRQRPKQMLKLGSERTLFQMAVDRLQGIFPFDHIFVVTVEEQASALQQQCPQIPRDNYLLEPMPRGTASVVGLAGLALQAVDPQAVMAVLTADHFIQNVDLFQQLLRSAYACAEDDYLVTLGIQPTFPATGYGYVQRSGSLGAFNGKPAYQVLRFTEKPNLERAQQMIDAKDHYWNSGMFFWKVERIMREFHQLMPDLARKLDEIAAAWKSDQRVSVLHQVWGTIKPETIDYGIMEKAERVAVLPAENLNWNDVGSWDSLFEVLPGDENGNINLGANHLGLDTHGTLIESSDKDRLIVTIGAENLVIIDTPDALLVCPKERSQEIKQIVTMLKQQQQEDYL